ncbi:MAG: response regulator [Filimonas sp.]|nr:response regulator [Filimonas sp.]
MDKAIKTLIVDDNDINQMVLNAILSSQSERLQGTIGQHYPFDVKRMGDAASALEELDILQFDLICTDLLMPYMNGEEFVIRLAESGYKGALVIMTQVTEHTQTFINRIRKTYPGCAVLNKPFLYKEVSDSIARVLNLPLGLTSDNIK